MGKGIKKISFIFKKIGDMISTIFLVCFYFTIFALFAIPVKIIKDFYSRREKASNFIIRSKTYDKLEDFSREG